MSNEQNGKLTFLVGSYLIENLAFVVVRFICPIIYFRLRFCGSKCVSKRNRLEELSTGLTVLTVSLVCKFVAALLTGIQKCHLVIATIAFLTTEISTVMSIKWWHCSFNYTILMSSRWLIITFTHCYTHGRTIVNGWTTKSLIKHLRQQQHCHICQLINVHVFLVNHKLIMMSLRLHSSILRESVYARQCIKTRFLVLTTKPSILNKTAKFLVFFFLTDKALLLTAFYFLL